MSRDWYKDEPIINIQGQMCEHDEIRIQANRAGLLVLKDAISQAIGSDGKYNYKRTIWASDGEGYQIEIMEMADPEHDEPIDHYWMYQAQKECQNMKDGHCIAERQKD